MLKELDYLIQLSPEQLSNHTKKSTKKFDWWYMFILVIYMGMATPETSRMDNTLSGNPIPLVLPIILTWILYVKHHVNFKSTDLKIILFLYLIWSILSFAKWKEYSMSEFSYYFFPLYNILVAYVQVRAFGKELIPLYENIIVVFAKISIVFWLIYILHIPILDDMATIFPDFSMGNSILYLFSWNNLSLLPPGGTGYRNPGCAWEPGRFAIMLVLGVYCNICLNGIKFNRNKNIFWLFAAILSTFSTTGVITVIVLYLITLFKKINTKTILIFIALTPLLYGIYSLDFIGEKVTLKLEESQDISRLFGQFSYNSGNHQEGEYLGSIDRFDAAVFEAINLYNDPILGYSNNFKHSFFYRELTTNYSLAHGTIKVLSTYGLIFGLIIYYWLFRSSKIISFLYPHSQRFALALIFILSAISYRVFAIPVFTSFWLFGIFYPIRFNHTTRELQKY